MSALPDRLIAHRARIRVSVCLARWAEKRPRAEEHQAAEDLTHDPDLGASCSSWALGVADQAFGRRKRAHLPRYVRSGTRSTGWAWKGATTDDGAEIPALGIAYKPRDPRDAEPGDILTVGHDGARPEHTTVIIAIVREAGRITGFWCIGFNQSGVDRDGKRISGGLALTFYPMAPAGDRMSAYKLVSVPLDAYEDGPATVTFDPALVEAGRVAFKRLTGIDISEQAAPPTTCSACGQPLPRVGVAVS